MTTRKNLLAKYGSEAAVSAHYREMQKKSRATFDAKAVAKKLQERYGDDYFSKLGKKGGQSGGKRTTN